MNPNIEETDDVIFAIVPCEKRQATFDDVDCTPPDPDELDELDLDLLLH